MQNLLELAYHIATPGGYKSVPAPVDGDPTIPWFWDWCALHVPQWAGDGITDLLTPPPGLSQSGTYPTGDGYGAYNPFYALDGTRFGSIESFRRFISIAHAYGLRVHVDIVLHQRDGGNNGVYTFPGSDPKVMNGRWPLQPWCFVGNPPRGPRDSIPSPNDDFGFGDECRYWPEYMWTNARAAVGWLFSSTGADGGRIDDTKALNVPFVYGLQTNGVPAGKWFCGEYYDGNPQNLSWIVWNSGMQGRSSTFDFSIRWPLQRMCNSGGNWDMRQWNQTTFAQMSPMQAVTFCENHDTDLSFPVIWNKLLAYAILSGWLGLMGIFGRDYYQYTNCYGLRPEIANLIWIRNMFANGDLVIRYTDYSLLVFERVGTDFPGGVWFINNAIGSLKNPNDWREITVQTAMTPGTKVHDYSMQGGQDKWVNSNGTLTVWVPPNQNGAGFVIYAQDGHQGSVPYVPTPTETTQMFEGADDLPGNAGPAIGGKTVETGAIWTDANKRVVMKLTAGDTNQSLYLLDGAGTLLMPDENGVVTTKLRGRHVICVVSSAIAGYKSNFEVTVTYTGMANLQQADWAPAKVAPHPHDEALETNAGIRRIVRALRVAGSK